MCVSSKHRTARSESQAHCVREHWGQLVATQWGRRAEPRAWDTQELSTASPFPHCPGRKKGVPSHTLSGREDCAGEVGRSPAATRGRGHRSQGRMLLAACGLAEWPQSPPPQSGARMSPTPRAWGGRTEHCGGREWSRGAGGVFLGAGSAGTQVLTARRPDSLSATSRNPTSLPESEKGQGAPVHTHKPYPFAMWNRISKRKGAEF